MKKKIGFIQLSKMDDLGDSSMRLRHHLISSSHLSLTLLIID